MQSILSPGFDRGDFARLTDLLRGPRGRFILSLNNVPEVRELFAWARIEAVETTYSINRKDNSQKAGELIITSAD